MLRRGCACSMCQLPCSSMVPNRTPHASICRRWHISRSSVLRAWALSVSRAFVSFFITHRMATRQSRASSSSLICCDLTISYCPWNCLYDICSYQGYVMLPTSRPKGRVWAGTPRAPQGGGRPLDPRLWRALHSPVKETRPLTLSRLHAMLHASGMREDNTSADSEEEHAQTEIISANLAGATRATTRARDEPHADGWPEAGEQ